MRAPTPSRALACGLLLAAGCTSAMRDPPVASAERVDEDAEVARHGPGVMRFDPIGPDAALVLVDNGGQYSLTRIDTTATPQWMLPVNNKLRTDWSNIFAVDGDQVIFWGAELKIHALADGSLRRSLVEVPAWLAVKRDEARGLFHMRPSAIDRRLFIPLSNGEQTWITAYDAASGAELWRLERPGQSNAYPAPGGLVHVLHGEWPITFGAPRTASDSLLIQEPRHSELVDAATGVVVRKFSHVGLCWVDGWLLAVRPNGTLDAWDSAADRQVNGKRAVLPFATTVLEWPSSHALARCHRSGDRLWLVTASDGFFGDTKYTVLAPGPSGLGQTLRIEGDYLQDSDYGKWLTLAGDGTTRGPGLFDIEAGQVAWMQDPTVDPILHTSWGASDDTLYFERHVDKTTYILALDRGTGALLAAVAVEGAWLEALEHGRLWLLAPALTPGYPVALAVLDARTLRPIAPPGPGITVSDRGAIARAAWQPAPPDAGALWGLEQQRPVSPRTPH